MMSESEEINDARENAFASEDQKACFVAGTLVHTAEGLRPISELKVGDLVLSRSEQGGENVYKSVLKTIKNMDKTILVNEYMISDPWGESARKKFCIVSTRDHRFWLNDVGWIAAHRLSENGGRVPMWSLANGENCWYVCSRTPLRTETEAVYVQDYDDFREGGELLDIWTSHYGESVAFDWENWTDDGNTPKPATTDVYTIEVEDYNTYFVGQHGVWVQV